MLLHAVCLPPSCSAVAVSACMLVITIFKISLSHKRGSAVRFCTWVRAIPVMHANWEKKSLGGALMRRA